MQAKILTKTTNEPISDGFKLEVSNFTVSQKPKTILQRIAESDKNAVGECLESYGNYVWTLAKKCCADEAETEELVQKIFQDIWKNAENFDAERSDEKTFIAVLSLRRMLNKATNASTVR